VGKVLREATPEDERTRDDVWLKEREAFNGCRDQIAEHHVAMQLIDAEQLFGGERLIFYYLSEERVDFRELVKSLESSSLADVFIQCLARRSMHRWART
jgi:cell fate regulator YaaT (PSP1 superfamily)